MEALRYNQNKTRYDLLEPHAIEQLAKVFTKGAEKYEDRNWEKGMKWSKMLASLKRHLAAFEQGEDYDKESELEHMAHVAWNALGLVTYAKTHPELDDRRHDYLHPKRIGLDIDECIADFTTMYGETVNTTTTPSHWSFCYNITSNFDKWATDGTLNAKYLDINPLLNGADLPFEPACYITHRPISTAITEQWLLKHGFPLKPVYGAKNREDKTKIALAEKLDYFIDDNYNTFVEMNKAGVCCFLMDASHNQKYNVGYKRILNFADFKTRFL